MDIRDKDRKTNEHLTSYSTWTEQKTKRSWLNIGWNGVERWAGLRKAGGVERSVERWAAEREWTGGHKNQI